MTSEFVLQIGKEALWMASILAMPVLAAGMLVGVLISIFQAVTQIQDQSISFVPKLVISAAAIIAFGPWMLEKIVSFATHILGNLKFYIQ